MVSMSKPTTGSTAEKCRAEHNDLYIILMYVHTLMIYTYIHVHII